MSPAVTWRAASERDVTALTDLEQAANAAAIGHLFEGRPFPRDEVAATWRRRLSEEGTTVEVVDGADGLDVFCCVRGTRLEHLAVRPDRWGRGLARAAVERAVSAVGEAGGEPVLWCLVDNVRARGFYEHLGWTLSGCTARSQYPPHLDEVEYVYREDA